MKVRVGTHGISIAVLVIALVALGIAARASSARASPERYMEHLAYLSSDSMRGRGNGTPELERAADHIARTLDAYGLTPAGENGSFFQPVAITTSVTHGSATALQVNGVGLTRDLDFMPMPLSASGNYEGDVVFAGYGLTAPEQPWDDYADIDVSGKAVVVLTHGPWEARPLQHHVNSLSSFEAKARNARRHGARAVLFVIDANYHGERHPFEAITSGSIVPYDLGLLAAYVSREAIAPLFVRSGTTITDAQRRIDEAGTPRSFVMSASVRVTTEVMRTDMHVRNVVAAVRGSDPRLRDEWLIIGAHYDHLGRRRPRQASRTAAHEQTYHGADDNASGTAGLLELAHLFQRDRHELGRSVMFVAFAGEELGLMGSSHFVDHGPIPVDAMTAMLNLDMIGRLSKAPLNIMGTLIPSDLARWIRDANREPAISLAFSQAQSGSSDWAPFQLMGVPSLTFFSGLHDDYHRPSDTADKIDIAGSIKILTVIEETAREIATSGTNLATASPVLPLRDLTANPSFGAEPAFDTDTGTLQFGSIPPGSPAAKAGVLHGDVLVEFGELQVETEDDFVSALHCFRPGDMASFWVRRRGRLIRLMTTLDTARTAVAATGE